MAIKGLRGFRYCILSEDTEEILTYSEEIIKIAGARNISMAPEIAEGKLHGDDMLMESESVLDSIEVEIELTDLPLKQRAELTGQTYENGVLKENKDADAPEIAFGFMAPKSPKSGGGFRMYWLTKGAAKPLEEEMTTKEDDIEYQPQAVAFTFMPRVHDGEYRFIADTSEEGAPKEDEFFSVDFLQTGTGTPGGGEG